VTDDAGRAMDRMYRYQRHIYDLTRKYYLLGRDRLIAELAPPDGGHVLEIACGTGRNLIVAARRYPGARFYGFDVSAEMLAQADESIRRAGLQDRIRLAQGDATAFDPQTLFGRAAFDRVFVSYALSMIPPWQAAIASGLDVIGPDGSFHIIDFGDFAGLPGWFGRSLGAWLEMFAVTPRRELAPALQDLASARHLVALCRPLYGGYAIAARLCGDPAALDQAA
jgi:S-adenosylmethionine-diacylgycerolhomoserine-N-methlytransferase